MADTRWTNEQLEVITARDCNLLVAAAAGAGKTAVLVERIIRKITEDAQPVDIDRMLIVTFTNAAAAEMRERISEAVSAVLEKNPDSKRIQRQLALLNKSNITTIHSFCLDVIRSNFQYIDIDPGFRIADETEAFLMKAEVLNTLFEDLYLNEAENADFFDLLESYGGNRDDQVLQEMVLNIYEFTRSSPCPEKWTLEKGEDFLSLNERDFAATAWGKVLLDSVLLTLAGLKEQMSRAVDILEHASGLEKYLPVYLEERLAISKIINIFHSESLTKWDDLFQAFQSLVFNRLPSAGKDADREQQEHVKEVRDETKKRLQKIRDKVFTADSAEIWCDLHKVYPLIKCLTKLVNTFGEAYAEKKKEKSLVDFNDLEHFCLQILSEPDENGELRPSRVACGYRERFEEILVDEYQDSNLVQEIIIQMISKTDTDKPNVFMVGDVKQSIYRFRQAKPELFLEKYHRYSLERESAFRKILLFKNFRSREKVVAGVNFLFKQIMSVTVGELDYTDEEALHPGAFFPECTPEQQSETEAEFHLIQTAEDVTSVEEAYSDHDVEEAPDDSEDRLDEEMLDSIQCEARLIVQRIKELMQANGERQPFIVFDKNKKAYRDLEYRDIVILLRTTKNWAEVFHEEFVAEGIPSFTDIGTGFFKTSEVQVMLSLLQIIDNPLQDIPLLAVLRSPLVSFTSDDLAELRLAKRQAPLYDALKVLAQRSDTNDSDLNQRAAAFFSLLQRWQEMAQYTSTDQLLWRLYTETGYYGIVGAMPCGEQRQANLRILFERARQYEKTSLKGLFNFINFIEKLRSSKGDMGSAKILGENDNVVRIMSIHKSKGLEFPVVILAGCGKKFNLQDMNKSVLLHQELGFGPDVVDHRLRLAYPSLPKLAIREKIRSETLSEEMRILYVALTRAKEKLILTGAVPDISKAVAKWSRYTEEKGTALPHHVILRGERYLDWIGPALLRKSPEWSIRYWKKKDIRCRSDAEKETETAFLQWLCELEQSKDYAVEHREENMTQQAVFDFPWEEVQRRLDWQYSYAKISKIPAKISVTELKRRFQESEPAWIQAVKMKKPLFLQERTGLSAAEAGTSMHFVMQHLDLKQDDIENQIQVMVGKDLLTEQQAAGIDPEKIRSFIVSRLGRRMLASAKIHREVPFNLEIPCSEVYPELDECDLETILLQGVIDCYFEEPDGLVIIDYKTDYVPDDGMEMIKNRYRIQIGYYAKALAILTGRKVKETYIYLFSNGEVVKYE